MVHLKRWVPRNKVVTSDGFLKRCPECGSSLKWPDYSEHIFGIICIKCHAVFEVKRKLFRSGFRVYLEEEPVEEMY